MPDRNTMVIGAGAVAALLAGGAYLMTRKPGSAGGATPAPGGQPNLPPPFSKVPGAPKGVTVRGISRTSVKVSWDAVPGATRYAVVHPAWQDQLESQVATTSETSATVTGLAPNSPYSVWVTAANDAGWGPKSALARGNTLP